MPFTRGLRIAHNNLVKASFTQVTFDTDLYSSGPGFVDSIPVNEDEIEREEREEVDQTMAKRKRYALSVSP